MVKPPRLLVSDGGSISVDERAATLSARMHRRVPVVYYRAGVVLDDRPRR